MTSTEHTGRTCFTDITPRSAPYLADAIRGVLPDAWQVLPDGRSTASVIQAACYPAIHEWRARQAPTTDGLTP